MISFSTFTIILLSFDKEGEKDKPNNTKKNTKAPSSAGSKKYYSKKKK